MGIKHLWTILTPFGERKPLYELQGKTVAIDLSCWVCEAQNVTDYYIQPKMYLRNLYFRTCYLLLMGVNMVFVLDGNAPELKYDTIAARNAIQFKGSKPKEDGAKVGKDRSRFNFVLKCCEEMLQYMGLVCIKSKGEAEALCAHLNADGLVDGCISQDSDCFAYGAKIVYRNFSISQQGQHAAQGGAVDVYDIQKATDAISLGRNKIIALALLCGSDYSSGVFGVGKEAAMKLFEIIPDEDILEHLRSWKTNTQVYNQLQRKLSDKNACTSCGHLGKLQAHNKLGCKECKTSAGCDASQFKDRRQQIKNELAVRGKAIADSNFPNEDLIQEFLTHKDKRVKLDLKWKQPDLIKFIKFTKKHLQWEELYAFEKFLPILTRWQLLNHHLLQSTPEILIPDHIKKKRNPKGVPSYEILWRDKADYYKDIIPSNQLTEVDMVKLWSTIEPQELVLQSHPNLVHTYEQSKIKPKKATKRKKKSKTTNVEDIENMLANTSISEPKPKKKTSIKCKPIDSYFKKAVLKNFKTSSLKEMTNNDSCNMDLSKFGDESDLDLSDIVQDIVSKPPGYIQENMEKLRCYFAESVAENEEHSNESSFFITATTENDLFEESMRSVAVSDDSEDEKEEASVPETPRDNDDYSFLETYVPLLERLKSKQ